MTAPDQTNAEVSDERLRYAGDKAKAVGWTLDPDYLDKINREILEETGYDTTIEVIEAALLREHSKSCPPPPRNGSRGWRRRTSNVSLEAPPFRL
jgi:hypothetical protein